MSDAVTAARPGQPAGGREYVASLTGLRGIAAIWVFLFHFPSLHPDIRTALTGSFFGTPLQSAIDMGFAGVNLFFVLSGFLLALPFADARLGHGKRPPLARYFRRRVLRVYPAYYAQLAILLAAGAWFVTWRPLAPPELAAHLVMFFNIGPAPVDAMVAVWWTLPVEFSFYLLLPLMAWFMTPRRWAWFLAAGIVMAFAYQSWATSHFGYSVYRSFLASVQLPGSFPLFLLGVSGAVLVRWMAARDISPPASRQADAMFLCGTAGTIAWLALAIMPNITAYWLGHWSMLSTPVVMGLLFTLMVLGLYWGSPLGRLLCANPVIYYSGLVSYSLYLWHFPVMQQVQSLGGEAYAALPGLGRFTVCLAAVFMASTVSYFLFERPFFRLRGQRKQASTGSKRVPA